MPANRVYETGIGFVRAVECPDCGHTKCDESCVCNCDAARSEDECARLIVLCRELAERLESLLIATAPGLTTHLDHEKDETRALISRMKAYCLVKAATNG